MGRDGGATGGVPGGTRIGPDGGIEPSGRRGVAVAGPSGMGGCGPEPGRAVGRAGTGPDCAGGGIVVVSAPLCPGGAETLGEESSIGP